MITLVRLGYEQKSGAILVGLFPSVALKWLLFVFRGDPEDFLVGGLTFKHLCNSVFT